MQVACSSPIAERGACGKRFLPNRSAALHRSSAPHDAPSGHLALRQTKQPGRRRGVDASYDVPALGPFAVRGEPKAGKQRGKSGFSAKASFLHSENQSANPLFAASNRPCYQNSDSTSPNSYRQGKIFKKSLPPILTPFQRRLENSCDSSSSRNAASALGSVRTVSHPGFPSLREYVRVKRTIIRA